MPPRTDPPQASSDTHAGADHETSIDADLNAFEELIRAAHLADLRSTTSTLMSDRWH